MKTSLRLLIASFGNPYHSDVLQLAKQLFSLSLPQMTKYCVMRECENIHSWISLISDLALSHQDGIYGFYRIGDSNMVMPFIIVTVV